MQTTKGLVAMALLLIPLSACSAQPTIAPTPTPSVVTVTVTPTQPTATSTSQTPVTTSPQPPAPVSTPTPTANSWMQISGKWNNKDTPPDEYGIGGAITYIDFTVQPPTIREELLDDPNYLRGTLKQVGPNKWMIIKRDGFDDQDRATWTLTRLPNGNISGKFQPKDGSVDPVKYLFKRQK